MIIFSIAFKSLLNRSFTSLLTILSIGFSVLLFVGIHKLEANLKESFANTISKTDLIVGARGNPLQIFLASIFHIGVPTNGIALSTYQFFKDHPAVKWTIPISLGDSFQGYPVVGTDINFYLYYTYLDNKKIQFAEGKVPNETFDIALGSEVARQLDIKVGDKLTIHHGLHASALPLEHHHEHPFQVIGLLRPTGTPIDNSLFISLDAIKEIHEEENEGATEKITSFLLSTKNRVESLHLQREINEFKNEPLSAVLPAVALSELWQIARYAENALQLISLCAVLLGLFIMMISLYNSLDARRREIAIFRSLGASAKFVFFLLIFEAFLISFLGCLTGVAFLYAGFFIINQFIVENIGIYIGITNLSLEEYALLLGIIFTGCLVGVIPAFKAYHNSLIDGLSPRL